MISIFLILPAPLMSGYVGCEHYTLAHQIEHFVGVVILTSRKDVGHLDLTRLPKLRCVCVCVCIAAV